MKKPLLGVRDFGLDNIDALVRHEPAFGKIFSFPSIMYGLKHRRVGDHHQSTLPFFFFFLLETNQALLAQLSSLIFIFIFPTAKAIHIPSLIKHAFTFSITLVFN